MNVLFVTWDGPQVSYLESLFLPIFGAIQKRGLARFSILQFTWGSQERISRTRAACDVHQISYQSARVWRRPLGLGSFATAMFGAAEVGRQVAAHSVDVLMPRSTLPALSVLRAGLNLPILFDADGLPLDERVDFAAACPETFAHRYQRDIEAQMIRRARVVTTRTKSAAAILHARGGAGTCDQKFHIVGNGRDSSIFHPGSVETRARMRQSLNVEEMAPLLVYAGSLGKQYCVDEMLTLFILLRQHRPDARLLVLTQNHTPLTERFSSFDLDSTHVIIRDAKPTEVPQLLACADAGLAFRRSSFSMRGVAPIKLGEYLLCGVPVIGSSGVGDADSIPQGASYLTHQMNSQELGGAADWLISHVMARREGVRDMARDCGIEFFSLDATVDAYVDALRAAEQ